MQYDKSGTLGAVDTIATSLYIALGTRLYLADPATQSGDLHDSSDKGAADEMTWLMRASTLPEIYQGDPWNLPDRGGKPGEHAADLNQFGFVWTSFDNSYLASPMQGSAADALIASEGGTALSC